MEIVVAGALGDLVLFTLPGFTAERRLFTRLVVADQVAAGNVLARLQEAGLEVVAVTELAAESSNPEEARHG
ncbi:MAG: hypothetical protein WCF04_04675 [Candidatus Nanopelagicales bacterium]